MGRFDCIMYTQYRLLNVFCTFSILSKLCMSVYTHYLHWGFFTFSVNFRYMVILIFYENLHGNPACLLVYRKVIF